MMGAVREWLLSVVTVTLLLSAIQLLVPEGSLRRAASLTGGLILLAALLQPAAGTKLRKLELDLSGYQEDIQRRQAELTATENEALAAGIAERVEAYISDKAEAWGLSLTVRVKTAPGAEGVPLPESVELWGSRSEELAAWMEEELGLAAERQVWHEQEDEG